MLLKPETTLNWGSPRETSFSKLRDQSWDIPDVLTAVSENPEIYFQMSHTYFQFPNPEKDYTSKEHIFKILVLKSNNSFLLVYVPKLPIFRTDCTNSRWMDIIMHHWDVYDLLQVHTSPYIVPPHLSVPKLAVCPLPLLWHGCCHKTHCGKFHLGSFLNFILNLVADYASWVVLYRYCVLFLYLYDIQVYILLLFGLPSFKWDSQRDCFFLLSGNSGNGVQTIVTLGPALFM